MSRNSYAQWNGNGTMKSSLYDDYPCYAAPDFSSTLEKPPIPEHNVGFAASTDSSTVFKTGSTGRPSSNLYLPHRKRKTKTRKCFGTLTRFEFCLIVLSSLLLLSLLSVLLFWLIVLQGYPVLTKGVNFADVRRIHEGLPATSSFDQSAVHHDKVVCTSRECIRIAGFFAANLNDKVDPCDDFYEFACGNYELNKMLPANKPLRHTISDVQSRLHKQVKSVLEETPRDDDESWDRLAKNYYQKCLREDVLEETGAAAFRALLRRVGGWPVLEGTRWKEWEHGWEPQLALLFNRTGINAVVLEVAVSHHPSDSNLTIIELDQPKWGAGSRWPYLSGADDPMIVNYTQMMVETAVNLGADRKTAEADMREAVEFELKLVNFSADEMIRRDPERSNNAFNLDSLKQVFPYINFREYVDTLFAGIANVTNLDTVIVREVEYFRGIQHVLQSTPKRAIANYIGWRVVQGFSPFLPPKMRDPFYEFKANQTGMFNSPIPDRWEDCVTLSIIMLDMPVGKLFVEHFFDNSSMDKMTELTSYLKSAFINQLHKLEWMDAATKERAIEKAHFIQYKSGYPQTLFNATWMAENWGLMEGSKTEPLLDLSVRIKLARVREELLRLKQPQDRSLWFQSPAQVDAFYAPNLNEMIFPAGIMQFPFLTVGVPNYVTYAMVGAVVGHEVSHAFDDQGGRYDKLGNLHDWWDAETAQKFFEKVECFARQYGAVRVDEVGVHLNGRLSVGENIADNGGVKTAYAAYKSWLADTAASEPALPGFQNFTSDQLFFLAYANNWCSMVRPKHYVQLILTDVHAPAKYRAIIPLRNRPEFAAAFNCARGSRMNPEHKCQAW